MIDIDNSAYPTAPDLIARGWRRLSRIEAQKTHGELLNTTIEPGRFPGAPNPDDPRWGIDHYLGWFTDGVYNYHNYNTSTVRRHCDIPCLVTYYHVTKKYKK